MWLTVILMLIIFLLTIINIAMEEYPSLRALYMFRKIPGDRGYPLIGCLHYVWSLTGPDVMLFLRDYIAKYPRLSYMNVAGVLAVFVNKPQDVQMILSSVQHIKKGKEYNLVTPWLNEGLLTSFGSKWHSRRKLLTPTFHFRILEDSLSNMNASVNKLLEKLPVGKAIKIEDYITRCTLDIIGESAMGINLKAQSEAGQSYVQSVKRTGELVILRLISTLHNKPWYYKLTQNGKSFFKNLNILHAFTDKIIQERKESYKNVEFDVDHNTGKKVRRAFLDCLLETQKKDPEQLTDLDIREEVDTFMFEGHDTTSSALCFTLWLLGQNPDDQEKVYQELKYIYGDEVRDVTIAETHQMVHLEKVIKESLRLYPSVPYISRQLTQDCILEDGTVIPATANCIITPYFLHRNTEYFPDPEKFDPERFSEENSAGRHPFVYIPFSAGPRNCIGQKFAMLEMKVTLAKILQKLEVKSITEREEFKVLPYLIIRPTVPLKLFFVPRVV